MKSFHYATTDTDIEIANHFLLLSVEDIANAIKIASGFCTRKFPLTDDSLAGVCAASIIGVIYKYNNNIHGFNHVRDYLRLLFATDITEIVTQASRQELIIIYNSTWGAFVELLIELRTQLEISTAYFEALIDDLTAMINDIWLHYGHIITDRYLRCYQ